MDVKINIGILITSTLALVQIAYIANQDSCTWGYLQHGGTIGISCLIGMALSSAIRQLARD